MEIHGMNDPFFNYEAARTMFQEIPVFLRIPYALRYSQNWSIEAIAKELATTPVDIRARIQYARKTFIRTKKRNEIILQYLRILCREARKQASVVDQSAIPAVAEGVAQTAQTVTHSVAHDVVAVSETVTTNFESVKETAATGVAAVTQLLGSQAFVSGFTKIALPVVWFLMLIASGRVWGTSVIENAKTLFVRRWLVKQLFFVYCAVLAFPLFGLVVSTILFVFVNPQNQQIVAIITNTVVAVLVFACFGHGYLKYLTLSQSEEYDDETAYKKLERLVQYGMKCLTVCLWGFTLILAIVFFISDGMNHLEANRYPEFAMVLCVPVAFGAVLMHVHYGTFQYLKYFLYLSKEKQTIRHDSKQQIPIIGTWLSKIDRKFRQEFGIILRFSAYPVGANVVHLIAVKTQATGAALELTGYTAWWGLVLLLNVRCPKYRKILLYSSFVAQVIILLWLRVAIYG